MHNLHSKNNNNIIVTTATLFMLGFFIVAASLGTGAVAAYGQVRDNSITDPSSDPVRETKAPMAASEDGNNVYVVWWTNRSGNWEVMFRASNDGGQTFGDKINLSNSSDTQSQTAEILAVGNNMVFVSWWELNADVHPHTNESVLRVSTDGGQTFGPLLMLGANGTLPGTGEEEGGEGGEETVEEEEAVGGTEVAE